MAKSNVTALRRERELPSRETLQQRLYGQREEATDLWAGLEAAYKLVDQAWDNADCMVFFRTESEPEAPAA